MRTLALLALLFCGCAGTADLLPKVGGALEQVRAGYVAGSDAIDKVAKIQTKICAVADLPADVVEICDDARKDLNEVDKGMDVAARAFNEAQSIYSAVNGAAK